MQYDAWQQDILDAEGNILLNKGRQIGGTQIFSIKAAEYIIANPGHQIVCTSLTLEQAENIIIMVLSYLEKNYPNQIITKGKHKTTKSRVWVRGDGHIISRPVGDTGNSVRSFTGNILYVDEGSRMPRAFWVAAKAILFTTGGNMWVSSTPAGKFQEKTRKLTYYYQAYINKKKRWTVIEQDSEWVANNRKVCETWTQEQKDEAIQFLKDEKDDMSEMEYGQEYLAKFYDDYRRVFSDTWIKKVCILPPSSKEVGFPMPLSVGGGKFLGVDIGGMGKDESTFEGLMRVGDVVMQFHHETTTKTSPVDTENKIISLDLRYDFEEIGIDDGGMGVGVLDHLLIVDSTRGKVIGLNNAKRIIDDDERTKTLYKEAMYINLLRMGEKGEIQLFDDDEVKASLRSILCEEKEKISGPYSHIAEGIIRAAWLAKDKDLNIWATSIKI